MENAMVNQFESSCCYNGNQWYDQYEYSAGVDPDYGRYKTLSPNLPGIYDGSYDAYNQNVTDFDTKSQYVQSDPFRAQKEPEIPHLKDYNKLKSSCEVERKMRPNAETFETKAAAKAPWDGYESCYNGDVQKNPFCEQPVLQIPANAEKDASKPLPNSGSEPYGNPPIYPWMTGGIGNGRI